MTVTSAAEASDRATNGGVVEVVQEFDWPPTILWGNEESSTDPEHVRRLGRALIAAADTIEPPQRSARIVEVPRRGWDAALVTIGGERLALIDAGLSEEGRVSVLTRLLRMRQP